MFNEKCQYCIELRANLSAEKPHCCWETESLKESAPLSCRLGSESPKQSIEIVRYDWGLNPPGYHWDSSPVWGSHFRPRLNCCLSFFSYVSFSSSSSLKFPQKLPSWSVLVLATFAKLSICSRYGLIQSSYLKGIRGDKMVGTSGYKGGVWIIHFTFLW